MHTADSVMVEKGDMTWNRKKKPDKISMAFRAILLISKLFKPGIFETFKPDLFIDGNFDFPTYDFDARVISIPGHSKGSIGILTGDGAFFCGDFLSNLFGRPSIAFCDNLEEFNASVVKLKQLNISIFYPGHGKLFTNDQFLKKFG